MYRQNRNILTDMKNKLVVTKGKREGGGTNWGRELRGTNYYV